MTKKERPHTRVVVVVVLAIQLAHDADVRSTTDRTLCSGHQSRAMLAAMRRAHD